MTIELIPTPVPVTEVHISHGVRFRCYSCPLALAVDDLLIDGYSAHVSPSELGINATNRHQQPFDTPVEFVIPLPPDAIQFVDDFDEERPVSPATFIIPLPRHLLRAQALPSVAPLAEGSAPPSGPRSPDGPCPRRSASP